MRTCLAQPRSKSIVANQEKKRRDARNEFLAAMGDEKFEHNEHILKKRQRYGKLKMADIGFIARREAEDRLAM